MKGKKTCLVGLLALLDRPPKQSGRVGIPLVAVLVPQLQELCLEHLPHIHYGLQRQHTH